MYILSSDWFREKKKYVSKTFFIFSLITGDYTHMFIRNTYLQRLKQDFLYTITFLNLCVQVENSK